MVCNESAECNCLNDETTELPLTGLRIAVVGGGLGGLAVTIGLLEAGADVRIYEKEEKLRDASQGVISVWPNGLKALGVLHPGLPDDIRSVGAPVTSVHNINRKGDEEAVVDISGIFHAQPELFGEGTVFTAWSDLQKVLAARIPAERICVNKKLEDLKDRGSDVSLRFEDGSEAWAHVAIAADGTFSKARRLLQKDGHIPDSSVRFFGQTNWASILQKHDPLPFGLCEEGALRVLSVDGDPKIAAMIVTLPGGRMFWQIRVPDETGNLRAGSTDEAGRLGTSGARQGLKEIIVGVPELAAAIEATPESLIYERSIYDLHPPLPHYAVGRVVLMGDAAHAPHSTPGQGANFAFEDAAVLVSHLAALPSDGNGVVQALQAYEAARLERCHSMQTWAAEGGGLQKGGTTTIVGAVDMDEVKRRQMVLLGWQPPSISHAPVQSP